MSNEAITVPEGRGVQEKKEEATITKHKRSKGNWRTKEYINKTEARQTGAVSKGEARKKL